MNARVHIVDLDLAVSRMIAATSAVIQHVSQLDDERTWSGDGATSMTSWLAARYNLVWGVAREWVRVARALRELPYIARAFAHSELSWDQVRPLTRFAKDENDAYWADEAVSRSPAALWDEARRHERVSTREPHEIHRSRYFEVTFDEEIPVAYLNGRVGVEEGAAMQTALNRRSEEIVLADAPHDPHGARQADALVELVTGGTNEAAAPVLVVHADVGVLTETEVVGLSETESGMKLGSEAVRRLACDARIEWNLERHDRVVGIGRGGRTIPGSMVRALRFRDRGCRFPGCERKKWLKAHHLVHWAWGGGTDLGNLVLLCHAHHRLIHEGGWRTSGHPAHDLRFHDPTGRPLRSASEQLVMRRATA